MVARSVSAAVACPSRAWTTFTDSPIENCARVRGRADVTVGDDGNAHRVDNGADGTSSLVLARLRGDSLVVIAEDVLSSSDQTYRFPTFVESAPHPTLAFVATENGAVAFRSGALARLPRRRRG